MARQYTTPEDAYFESSADFNKRRKRMVYSREGSYASLPKLRRLPPEVKPGAIKKGIVDDVEDCDTNRKTT